MLRVLFRQNPSNFATCVKLSLFVFARPTLFTRRWQLGLLAHAGLRAEDSQRLKAGSCGFTDVAVHGTCRNPKPRGVTNMPWAALRCGVLDEDWGKHAWDNLLVTCCRLQLLPVWQAISHPWTGVVGPRKMSKWRACGLFLRTLKASHR